MDSCWKKTKILDGDEECTIGAIVPEGGRDVMPKSYCGNFSLASGFISLHLFSLLSKFIEFRQLPQELSPQCCLDR
jgi:hypothetical protein